MHIVNVYFNIRSKMEITLQFDLIKLWAWVLDASRPPTQASKRHEYNIDCSHSSRACAHNGKWAGNHIININTYTIGCLQEARVGLPRSAYKYAGHMQGLLSPNFVHLSSYTQYPIDIVLTGMQYHRYDTEKCTSTTAVCANKAFTPLHIDGHAIHWLVRWSWTRICTVHTGTRLHFHSWTCIAESPLPDRELHSLLFSF